jgi:hypothetical protein
VAAVATGLAVLAWRWWVAGRLGGPVPVWDQWDREALTLYVPWVDGSFSWARLFEAHLEHRIAWTQAWNLGWFLIAGQWDPMVQMAAQACLPALTAAACVGGLFGARAGRGWRLVVVGGALIGFGGPQGFENTAWGFQSQFGFLVGFSLLAAYAAAKAEEGRAWRGVLVAAGLAAPLAMGAGLLAGPVVLIVAGLGVVAGGSWSRGARSLVVIGAGLLVWGIAWRSGSGAMDFARADSVLKFFMVWLGALAWPNCREPILAVVACAPVAGLTLVWLRRPERMDAAGKFILAAAAWACGCAAGFAWTRGGLAAEGAMPASRYHDVLGVLAWMNALALAWWWAGEGRGVEKRARRWVAGATLLWGGLTLWGGVALGREIVAGHLPEREARAAASFEAGQTTAAGGGVEALVAAGAHPSAEVVARVMREERFAELLPAELQAAPAGMMEAGLLGIALPAMAGGEQRWRGEFFELHRGAMVAFVAGDARSRVWWLEDEGGGERREWAPSGRVLGKWREWLVRAEPGVYRVVVETGAGAEAVTVLMPRPLSGAGWWARRVTGAGFVLLGFGAGFAALALGACFISRPGASGGR